MMLNIVLFGPPGSGKGTQARNIATKFNMHEISTGNLLRQEIRLQTPLGKEVEALVNSGSLVQDSIIYSLIKRRMDELSATQGYIFDGFPRTLKQAQDLDTLLSTRGSAIDLVISLKVEDEELINRITKRGKELNRTDDQSPSIIIRRLKEYYAKTAPVEEFYTNQLKLVKISGARDIDSIFESIATLIQETAYKKNA